MPTIKDIFGTVEPPVGGIGSADPAGDLGTLIGRGINLTLIITGIIALIYMLWGAVSYVTSGGDKEKLQKAQGRIRNAVVGIFVSVAVLVVWNTIFSLVFPNSGIIRSNRTGGFEFTIPTFDGGAGGGTGGSGGSHRR